MTAEREMLQFLQNTRCRKHWERIGFGRRAGVAAPLFSLHSERSLGIGEIPDLKLLIDWCSETGLSILQLLPLNDVGFDFRPYDAQSSFALEPMYLSLEQLAEANVKPFHAELEILREQFPTGGGRVPYGIKAQKVHVLWKIFRTLRPLDSEKFRVFLDMTRFWLRDYTLFKVIKERSHEKNWEYWDADLKAKSPAALERFEHENREKILFHQWMQWQLYEQFVAVKQYAARKGVLVMGDLPFLVSRDSADVWGHQDYFKLHLAAGAPPDLYLARGQRWGMPPYHWSHMEGRGYDYLIEKIRYAENFYDLFRIDHVIGVFRLWSIPVSEPMENAGLHGFFDPGDEGAWEEHGRKLITVMVESTRMLPCAEDLGVVPACSYKVLDEFGIPGMDVPRWMRNWEGSADFKRPEAYRLNSMAVLATHDMTSVRGWWKFEAGTIDEELFLRKCASRGLDSAALKPRLFDLAQSHHGRLRWKRAVENARTLLSILGKPEKEVKDLVDLYRTSYSEQEQFLNYLGLEARGGAVDPRLFTERVLEMANRSASVFSVQLLQEWLSLDPDFQYDPWEFRINFPGTMSERNWTLAVPFSLEKIRKLPINEKIRLLNKERQGQAAYPVKESKK